MLRVHHEIEQDMVLNGGDFLPQVLFPKMPANESIRCSPMHRSAGAPDGAKVGSSVAERYG